MEIDLAMLLCQQNRADIDRTRREADSTLIVYFADGHKERYTIEQQAEAIMKRGRPARKSKSHVDAD